MTTLENRPNSALVVIDVQNGVVGGAHQRDQVVATIAGLVDQARSDDVPVVWVQHADEETVHGSEEWQIVPELAPAADEPVIHKHHGDAFEGTDAEEVLADLEIGRLFLTGAQTDACVRATLHGAFVRGYDTVLVTDAHTTEDLTEWGAPAPELVIAHTNLYWGFQSAPGKTAGTVESGDVDFAAPG